MGDAEIFAETLQKWAGQGKKSAALVNAAVEVIKALSQEESVALGRLLTGDPVTDLAILRAAGVEQIVKSKFNVDPRAVLEFLNLLVGAAGALAPLFRK